MNLSERREFIIKSLSEPLPDPFKRKTSIMPNLYWNSYGPVHECPNLDLLEAVGTSSTNIESLRMVPTTTKILLTVQPGMVLAVGVRDPLKQGFSIRQYLAGRAADVAANNRGLNLVEPDEVENLRLRDLMFGLAHVTWRTPEEIRAGDQFLYETGFALGSRITFDLQLPNVEVLLDTACWTMIELCELLGIPTRDAQERIEWIAERAASFIAGYNCGALPDRDVVLWGKGLDGNPYMPFDDITVGAHLERWGTGAHGSRYGRTNFQFLKEQWLGAVSMIAEGRKLIINPIPSTASTEHFDYLRTHALLYRGLEFVNEKFDAGAELYWHTDRDLSGSRESEFWLPTRWPLIWGLLTNPAITVRVPMVPACLVEAVWQGGGRTKLRWDTMHDVPVIERTR